MTSRFKIPLLFGLFLLITSLTIVSQTDPAKASRMKMQGMYLYQFAKNVYWPSEYNTGDFLIGITEVKICLMSLITLSKIK